MACDWYVHSPYSPTLLVARQVATGYWATKLFFVDEFYSYVHDHPERVAELAVRRLEVDGTMTRLEYHREPDSHTWSVVEGFWPGPALLRVDIENERPRVDFQVTS